MPNRVRLPVRYRREGELVRVITSQENLMETIFKLSSYVGNTEMSIVEGKRNVGEARIIKDKGNTYTMIALYDDSPYIPARVTFYVAAPLENSGEFLANMMTIFEDVKEIEERISKDEFVIKFRSKIRRVGPFSSLGEEENVEIEMKRENLQDCVELKVKRIKIGNLKFEMSE